VNYTQKLRLLLDKKTKRRFLWLVLFSILVSVVEAIGISVIMPFVDIATNFEAIQTNRYYRWAFEFFNFNNEVDFSIAFGFVLIFFYIFRGGVNWIYSYAMAYFSESLYAQTTKKLFATYLAMPYQVFSNKNSSYLTKAIITEASLISIMIRSVLTMISEIFVIVFIYVLMLIANWQITLAFTIILIVKTLFLMRLISSRIKTIGRVREKVQAKFYEIINRIFGNFKQVKLQDKNRLQDIESDFSVSVDEYARVSALHAFLRDFPRLFLETSGFSLVVLLLIFLLYLNQSNISYILPTLSLFVLAMYRLLPSVNRIIRGYNDLMYYHKSIDIVNDELKTTQESLGGRSIEFGCKIKLTDIVFSYQKKVVLNRISLTINKGDKVAFIGESGSGKSTLVDLIIGLHRPEKGNLEIDGVALDESNVQNWRSQIGYIPQQVYLFDGTIADNVCFGRKLDGQQLELALKQSDIFDFLQKKQGSDTLVGEGGIQLSGGQKQRVAIARALYGQPEILVLDEATSALDDKTEQNIMNEIYKVSQNKTLIIIAHRLSTIKNCDKKYRVSDGSVKQI
jgi:ATP-binding cassette, subfamily B, bacterial PglK